MAGPAGSLPSNLQTAPGVARNAVSGRIRERIDRGVELIAARYEGPASLNTFRANRTKWDDTNRDLLRRLFSTDAARLAYDRAGHVPSEPVNPKIEMERLRDSVSDKLRLLEAILDQLGGEDSSLAGETGDTGSAGGAISAYGKPALVLHLGETATARTIGNFLESLRMKAVIATGRPAEGEVPLHNIEAYNDAAFAVVLVSADSQSTGGRPSIQPETLIWLGYIFGRMGTRRVVGLLPVGIEPPRDRLDIKYVPYDEHGTWKTLLTQRMRQSGLDV